MFRFLPVTTRNAVSRLLEEFGIVMSKQKEDLDGAGLSRNLGGLRRVDLSLENEALIPETLFFDNKQVRGGLKKCL